jgi:hypothetical protein
MSKVAIQGAVTGTGTFTLEAPATNTDRTLVLPDTSGEMYNQGNILGTVSESGGVPTGAIIERGSNANGEFVKYADGTMICVSSQVSNTGTEGQWDFPASFSEGPFCTGNNNYIATQESQVRALQTGKTTATKTNFIVWVAVNASSPSFIKSTAIQTLTAIGRWY